MFMNRRVSGRRRIWGKGIKRKGRKRERKRERDWGESEMEDSSLQVERNHGKTQYSLQAQWISSERNKCRFVFIQTMADCSKMYFGKGCVEGTYLLLFKTEQIAVSKNPIITWNFNKQDTIIHRLQWTQIFCLNVQSVLSHNCWMKFHWYGECSISLSLISWIRVSLSCMRSVYNHIISLVMTLIA